MSASTNISSRAYRTPILVFRAFEALFAGIIIDSYQYTCCFVVTVVLFADAETQNIQPGELVKNQSRHSVLRSNILGVSDLQRRISPPAVPRSASGNCWLPNSISRILSGQRFEAFVQEYNRTIKCRI